MISVIRTAVALEGSYFCMCRTLGHTAIVIGVVKEVFTYWANRVHLIEVTRRKAEYTARLMDFPCITMRYMCDGVHFCRRPWLLHSTPNAIRSTIHPTLGSTRYAKNPSCNHGMIGFLCRYVSTDDLISGLGSRYRIISGYFLWNT